MSLLERVDLIRDPAPLSQMAVLFGEPFFETPASPTEILWDDPLVITEVSTYYAFWKLSDDRMLVGHVKEGRGLAQHYDAVQRRFVDGNRSSEAVNFFRGLGASVRSAGAESVRNQFGDWVVEGHQVFDERAALADEDTWTYEAWIRMPRGSSRSAPATRLTPEAPVVEPVRSSNPSAATPASTRQTPSHPTETAHPDPEWRQSPFELIYDGVLSRLEREIEISGGRKVWNRWHFARPYLMSVSLQDQNEVYRQAEDPALIRDPEYKVSSSLKVLHVATSLEDGDKLGAFMFFSGTDWAAFLTKFEERLRREGRPRDADEVSRTLDDVRNALNSAARLGHGDWMQWSNMIEFSVNDIRTGNVKSDFLRAAIYAVDARRDSGR